MKVVVAGDTQVGKTSIIDRFTNNRFKVGIAPTIGAAFQTHIINTEKGTVTLQIWDTAGQERYRALAPMYFRSAGVAILCFDVTNAETFISLEIWLNEIESKAPPGIPIIIVGNKIDMKESRMVDSEVAWKYMFEHNNIYDYVEVSAKTGEGVNELFEMVAHLFIKSSHKEEIQLLHEKNSKKRECC